VCQDPREADVRQLTNKRFAFTLLSYLRADGEASRPPHPGSADTDAHRNKIQRPRKPWQRDSLRSSRRVSTTPGFSTLTVRPAAQSSSMRRRLKPCVKPALQASCALLPPHEQPLTARGTQPASDRRLQRRSNLSRLAACSSLSLFGRLAAFRLQPRPRLLFVECITTISMICVHKKSLDRVNKYAPAQNAEAMARSRNIYTVVLIRTPA